MIIKKGTQFIILASILFALIRTSYNDFDAYHINHFNLINDLRAHDNMDNVN